MQTPVANVAVEGDVGQKKWYVGGTLHEASAIDWQHATAEDKLATVADLLARAWENDLLAPDVRTQIGTIEDFKPFAATLTADLDEAFNPGENPEGNRDQFANQDVASTAAVLMIMRGWVQ